MIVFAAHGCRARPGSTSPPAANQATRSPLCRPARHQRPPTSPRPWTLGAAARDARLWSQLALLVRTRRWAGLRRTRRLSTSLAPTWSYTRSARPHSLPLLPTECCFAKFNFRREPRHSHQHCAHCSHDRWCIAAAWTALEVTQRATWSVFEARGRYSAALTPGGSAQSSGERFLHTAHTRDRLLSSRSGFAAHEGAVSRCSRSAVRLCGSVWTLITADATTNCPAVSAGLPWAACPGRMMACQRRNPLQAPSATSLGA